MNNDDARLDESQNNPDAKEIDSAPEQKRVKAKKRKNPRKSKNKGDEFSTQEVMPIPFDPSTRRALHVTELTDEQFEALKNAKVPEEYAYLNDLLEPEDTPEPEKTLEEIAEKELEEVITNDFLQRTETFVSAVAKAREEMLADVPDASQPEKPKQKRKPTKLKDLVKFRRTGRW